jgi:release factor glutamine methyltransferase
VTDQPSIAQLVAAAERVLAEAGVPSPGFDARALAEWSFDLDRRQVLLGALRPGADELSGFAAAVERRRLREPLQHITGRTWFRHLELAVERGVFVPRPETEVVAQAAIDAALGLSAPLVVDLCCGAGGIAVAVATEVPGSRVVAVDLSAAAVRLTRRNADRAGVGALRLEQGDVREPELLVDLDGSVDVVVSNPPYIPPDAEPVDPEVRDHDPALALYGGGTDGLELPAAVLVAAHRLLRPGGVVVMEHAEVQDAAVRALAADLGFTALRTIADLTGRPRAVVATR